MYTRRNFDLVVVKEDHQTAILMPQYFIFFLLFRVNSYISPVLRDSAPDPLYDNSATGYGYQSFGSTDHMGRRSPCHVGVTSNPIKGMSTLERSMSKAKNLKNDGTKFKTEGNMVKSSDVLS